MQCYNAQFSFPIRCNVHVLYASSLIPALVEILVHRPKHEIELLKLNIFLSQRPTFHHNEYAMLLRLQKRENKL